MVPVRSQAEQLLFMSPVDVADRVLRRIGNDSLEFSTDELSRDESRLATIPTDSPKGIPLLMHTERNGEYQKLIIALLAGLLLACALIIVRLLHARNRCMAGTVSSDPVVTSVSDEMLRSRGNSDFGNTGKIRASSSSSAAGLSQDHSATKPESAAQAPPPAKVEEISPRTQALMVYKKSIPYTELRGLSEDNKVAQTTKYRIVENNEYVLEKEEGAGIVRTTKHEVREYFPESAGAELIEEAKSASKKAGNELKSDCVSLDDNKIMLGYRTERTPEESGTESRSFFAMAINKENERCDENGRFAKSFDSVTLLGSGGFAEVFRARYILDGKFYAIKRIVIQHDVQQRVKKRKAYREIRAMQTLDHPDIVRYITCWIEIPSTSMMPTANTLLSPGLPTLVSKASVTIEELPGESNAPPTEGLGFEWDRGNNNDSTKLSHKMISQSGAAGKDLGEQQVALRNADQNKEVSELDSSAAGVQWDRGESKTHIATHASKLPRPLEQKVESEESNNVDLVFYIQMVLYARTLRNYLTERTAIETVRNLKYFRQIATAIHHIHNKGWIHRDMKPANVFLDENDNAKVGDFGLAVEIKSTEEDSLDSQVSHGTSATHTENVGTRQYLSIEQESGCYSEKVDIYSMGLILLELCCNFSTGHEKSDAFDEIRRNHRLPDCFDRAKHADEAQLILAMTEREPDARPSAAEILASPALKAWRRRVRAAAEP